MLRVNSLFLFITNQTNTTIANTFDKILSNIVN